MNFANKHFSDSTAIPSPKHSLACVQTKQFFSFAALGVDSGAEAVGGRESQGGTAGVRGTKRCHHDRRHGRPARAVRHAVPPLREFAVSAPCVPGRATEVAFLPCWCNYLFGPKQKIQFIQIKDHFEWVLLARKVHLISEQFAAAHLLFPTEREM